MCAAMPVKIYLHRMVFRDKILWTGSFDEKKGEGETSIIEFPYLQA